MVTKQIGLGGRVLMAAALASACSRPDDAPAEGGSGLSNPARGGPRAGGAPVESLDLEAMLSPVPEYEGVGRNLFAYGPPRRPANAVAERTESQPVDTTPRPAPPPRPAPRPGPSPTARLDMKYAGFLEKTGPDGAKAKYAIFLDGNEILAGTEGELLANRFTVVEIGLESVTVSPTGSSATQRIPLQSK
jgi:hypothetical protein